MEGRLARNIRLFRTLYPYCTTLCLFTTAKVPVKEHLPGTGKVSSNIKTLLAAGA